MKIFLKKILPSFVLSGYHFALARSAAMVYRFPARKLTVIGITGTKGKSTIAYLVMRMLENMGYKVGLSGTIMFKAAEEEEPNDLKMTMPGRFRIQKLLRRMVRKGCQYAVIETTSEGVLQHRHVGIDYDVMVFTNLTPEHLERHGGFENYKNAKKKLFAYLTKTFRKTGIPKSIVVNIDDDYAVEFLDHEADQKIQVSLDKSSADVSATDVEISPRGISFRVRGQNFRMSLLGVVNVYNALLAIGVGRALGFSIEVMRPALVRVLGVPGRMELIEEGQSFGVVVDYAHEPRSMELLYQALRELLGRSAGRIIALTGSAGGGRDTSRRGVLGRLAGKYCDLVIVTNEDPYDEDPAKIIDEVAAGVLAAGKREGENLWRVASRKEAMLKAYALARRGDIVVFSGKGSELAIAGPHGTLFPWDERGMARELLKQHGRRP